MSAESFIKRSFCMHVAAVCSEETELRVRKNNLTFCEMLRPFCHLSVDGMWAESKPLWDWQRDVCKFSITCYVCGSSSYALLAVPLCTRVPQRPIAWSLSHCIVHCCCISVRSLTSQSPHSAVPIRDPQGHTYNAKDIHVRVVEPMADGHSDSKLRLILDSTVRWTESKIAETERRKGNTGVIHWRACSCAPVCIFQLSFPIPQGSVSCVLWF